MSLRILRSIVLGVSFAALLTGYAAAQPADTQAKSSRLPTLFLVGDLASLPAGSDSLTESFDAKHLSLASSPSGGRTIRAYVNSGDWETLLNQMKPGDFVLIEFSPANLSAGEKDAAIRTLQGTGDSTFEYVNPATQKLELVHTYGWYLRRMAVDAINHGASPILCSPPAASRTSAINHPTAAEPTAGDWSRAIATELRIPFVDLTASGATLTASALRSGLEALQPDPLAPYLKPKS